MSKKKNNPENNEELTALTSKKFHLQKKDDLRGLPNSDNFEKNALEDERIQLASKFNIELDRPKQSNRIKALFDLYQRFLAKSKVNSLLYTDVIDSCKELIEIYKKQKAEVRKLEGLDETKEFVKTRLAYVVNKYRSKVLELEEKIANSKNLLDMYKNRHTNVTSLTSEQKEVLTKLEGDAWSNHLKTFDVNKELRNTIIGYENRLCVYKVGKLFLDYKLYVNQELDRYRENLKKLNQENRYEYNEILRHFNLPADKLTDFQLFVQRKIESRLFDAQELKTSFGKFFDYDISQIDRMVDEVKRQQEKDLLNLVDVINHYKTSLLKKQSKSDAEVELLVNYIQKRYEEKVHQIYHKLKEYEGSFEFQNNLDGEYKAVLLELNQKEFQIRLEKTKHKFTNIIKPLTDDFDNMVVLTKRDYVFDVKKKKEKLLELKSLEQVNVKKISDFFEKEKKALEELFDRKHKMIESPSEFTKFEFEKIVEKLKKDCQIICDDIVVYNEKYWTNANIEFNSEAKKFLTKFHYENAPWTHLWKKGSRAWMHDYLLVNLSSEYLRHVGDSLKNFSPEAQLYSNIGKALTQFNEKSREIYKVRDEIEFEQLIRLNTVPAVEMGEVKKDFSQQLTTLKNEKDNFLRILKLFQENLEKRKH